MIEVWKKLASDNSQNNSGQNMTSKSSTGDQVNPNGGEQFKHNPDMGYGNDTISMDNQRDHQATDNNLDKNLDKDPKKETPDQKADDKTNREAQGQMGGMGQDEYNRLRDADRAEEKAKNNGKQHQSLGDKAKNALKNSGGVATDGMNAEKQKDDDKNRKDAKDMGSNNRDDDDETEMSKKAGSSKLMGPLKAKLMAILHGVEAAIGAGAAAAYGADMIKNGAKKLWVKIQVGFHHIGEIMQNVGHKIFTHLPKWLQHGMEKVGHAIGNATDKITGAAEKGLVKATGGKLTMAKAAMVVHAAPVALLGGLGVYGATQAVKIVKDGGTLLSTMQKNNVQKWDSMLCDFGSALKSALGQSEDGLRNKVVELAKTRVAAKVPYVWGGTDWDKGMDCSGLVMNCLHKAGLSDCPRTSGAQYQWLMSKGCKREDVKDAKPGDLGFMGDNGSEHVCIYIGNGQIIEEPEPGQPCHQTKVYSGLYFVDCSKIYGSTNVAGATGNTTSSGSGNSSLINNNNQKTIFDTLTKKYGFSGAAAAGILGNTAQESHGGDPFIVQSPPGDKDNPDGLGNTGYGIFQFTPPSGYASWMHQHNESKASVEDELAYALTPGTPKSVYTTLKNKGVWDQLTHASDPVKACDIFNNDYEIAGNAMLGQRESYARQAYDTYNGSSISANDGLLSKIGSGGAGNLAAGNDATAKNDSQMEMCGKSQTNDGNGNVADGTGSIKESSPSGILKWTKDDVPADVKQYIHDPAAVGLSWGSAKGWSTPGGQCVDFSVSYFHLLWSGSPGHVPGNGKDIAGGFAKAMGGQLSDQPHAGAVVSIQSGTPESPAVDGQNYGHTFIVEHVLANGDIIVAEENMEGFGMKGGSGDDVGQPETWNFGWLSQKTYQSWHAQFFTPSKGQPNWGK